MAELVYLLCALTSLACAYLLGKAYRNLRTRFLFWSAMCFVGLALNNMLLFIDLAILPTAIDLSPMRTAVGLIATSVMLCAFVWEVE